MSMAEFIINWLATIARQAVLALLSLVSLCLGIFLMRKPRLAIQIQKKFYEKINWRMEPISMEKEIRNTRLMGGFLILIFIAVLGLTLAKK
jgi:hypothetical protein